MVFKNMNEELNNLYVFLAELESLLDQIVVIPEELFTIDGEWTEQHLTWLEDNVSMESPIYRAYIRYFDHVVHRLRHLDIFMEFDSVLSHEILEEGEPDMIVQILRGLSSPELKENSSVGRLLLTHHALIRLFDYLEMRSEPNGLAFHLFRKSSRRLFRSQLRYLDDTLELLDFADTNRYTDFLTQAFYLNWPDIQPRVWITNPQQLATATEQLYAGIKFAQLAYGQRGIVKGNAMTLHPYIIHFAHGIQGKQDADGFFHLQRNMNGYIAYTEEDEPRIIYGLTGTRPSSLANWKTNIGQYFCGPNLPYLYAWGILDSILLGKSHREGFKASKVEVYGHSLGGGMMQFAVANHPSDMVSGFGYNSAGLGWKTIESMQLRNVGKITHLYLPYDQVFTIPGSFQLGGAVKIAGAPVIDLCFAHSLAAMKKRSGRYKNDIACIV